MRQRVVERTIAAIYLVRNGSDCWISISGFRAGAHLPCRAQAGTEPWNAATLELVGLKLCWVNSDTCANSMEL